MYQLCFYVPESHLELVKQALFSVGAGKIGHYDCCAWQIEGQGQFRPLSDSSPFLGKANELSYVKEYRVEMVVEDALINAAVDALQQAHPYEEPAFYYSLVNSLAG